MNENQNVVSTTEFGDIPALGMGTSYKTPVVVELSVIKRLTDKLVSVHFSEIKAGFRAKLQNVNNIEDYVNLLENELAFQRTVNQIQNIEVGYNVQEEEEVTQVMA